MSKAVPRDQRTFQFWGVPVKVKHPVSLEVSFNNSEIFSGKLDTARDIRYLKNRDHAKYSCKLFECILPFGITGGIPLSIKVFDGVLFFGNVYANYTYGTENLWDPPAVSFNTLCNGADSKKNVYIDGIPHCMPEEHAWFYRISHNQVFSCQVFYPPEYENFTLPSGYAEQILISGPDPLNL